MTASIVAAWVLAHVLGSAFALALFAISPREPDGD
jgi:phosphate/sulfate permease